ncbi:ethylbenzene dehydrogenase-related protein [Motiliproteus sediminis]|uniref:ethylbenzene dehydrogenase-related protein n=1 Tax=Motiliproteus sediminis TaxID=1468178 RepID=UPI001AEFA0FB|nr:ethylbenzene dehydrogenase-related protein [Motiliproteus sediminis]
MKLPKHARYGVMVAALGLASSAVAEMAAPRDLVVQKMTTAPVIDGNLSEWGSAWELIPVDEAIEGDNKNRLGKVDVELQVAVAGDEIFVAARWPDKSESRAYKPWSWKKARKRYSRGKDRDDMFALRFDMGGDFRTCMIEKANYDVDVWLWSAGRSDQVNYATDGWHRISFELQMDAAEYEMDDGTVIYIKKQSDEGQAGFENNKPKRKEFEGDELPGVELVGEPRGSIGDVAAKGVWKDGYWHLEMKRKLDTGHSDDVSLAGIDSIRSQIGVFDQGFAEHKSVSGELRLDFTQAR